MAARSECSNDQARSHDGRRSRSKPAAKFPTTVYSPDATTKAVDITHRGDTRLEVELGRLRQVGLLPEVVQLEEHHFN